MPGRPVQAKIYQYGRCNCRRSTDGVPRRPKAQAALALINGTMIDGTGAHAVSNGALLLGGDRILAAGSLPRIKIPAGVATIDVQGGTILPGFINAHVHTAYNETLLKTWAQSGVTTVRDLGAFVHYSDELFRKRDGLCAVPECARLTAVGNFINVSGGYPEAFWGGYILSADSPVAARQQVNRLIDAGAGPSRPITCSKIRTRISTYPNGKSP